MPDLDRLTSLPPETLSQICTLYHESRTAADANADINNNNIDDDDRGDFFDTPRLRPRVLPHDPTLQLVCRHLRNVEHSIPQFWTTVSTSMTPETISAYLARTRSRLDAMHVDVVIFVPKGEERRTPRARCRCAQLAVLGRHAHRFTSAFVRIRSLSNDVTASGPISRSVDSDGNDDDDDDEAHDCLTTLSSLSLSLSSLSTLSLSAHVRLFDPDRPASPEAERRSELVLAWLARLRNTGLRDVKMELPGHDGARLWRGHRLGTVQDKIMKALKGEGQEGRPKFWFHFP